jgi:meso-butanediol dehydrogenase / (S,S)-butanediol dehydrogenase / diacetyl reductase
MGQDVQSDLDISLVDKVAVVTGAARNIGAATAVRLAQAGARVVAVDLTVESLADVVAEIEAISPGAAHPIACDVADRDAVAAMAAEASEWCDRLDILVNNVATTDRGSSVLDLPEEDWDSVIRIGLTSSFLCSKYVGQRIRDHGAGGVIVNLGSTSAFHGRKNVIAYSASKAGVINMTRSMAVQLAPFGIRVVSVSPNRVGSPVGEDLVPENREQRNLVGRSGRPMDIANAIRFVVSEQASFITGIDILVDGGSQQAG